MKDWLKWKIIPKEMSELEQWHIEWQEHRRWFAEFPIVAFVLDRMKAKIDGLPINNIHTARDSWREAMPAISVAYRSLYEITGDIKDFNTLLVPRDVLTKSTPRSN